MSISKRQIVDDYRIHQNDTGSPEVQIALLTSRINHLAEHFKKYPKDFSSRSGFLKLIGHRRRLLDYLKKHKKDKYKELLNKLELRR